MSQNTQGDNEDLRSYVLPDMPLNLIPPEPLGGVLTIGRRCPCGGAFSDIYEGTWTDEKGSTVSVCLKMLRQVGLDSTPDPVAQQERFGKRILRETWIWKNTTHPNIFPFLGYQVIREDPYLVSPWADQGNLEAYLRQRADLSAAERLQISLEASQGLSHLHNLQLPIVHGDVKPRNILIRSGCPAALCDFGISRIMAKSTGLTTGSVSVGTSGYQAKEIIAGHSPTRSSDVYAMAGVILATASGLGPYFNERTSAQVYIAVHQEKQIKPSDHPKLPESDPLWKFLRKCWSPDPAARPSAQEVTEELNRSLREYEGPPPSYETIAADPDSKSTL